MTNSTGKPKHQWYVWVLLCGEDHGWGACYDSLWGYDPRVFRTRSEACAARDALLSDDDCWEGHVPEFYVERQTVLVALENEEIALAVSEIMPPKGTRIPARVLRDTAAAYGVAAAGHLRRSAALKGASSLTHTHALMSGWMEQRGREYLDLIGQRPVLA